MSPRHAACDVIPHPRAEVASGQQSLRDRYQGVRAATLELCRPLATEDYVIQTMTDVSPTKWHLAHTTWFFETFVLVPALDDYRPFHEQYRYLFNSYYNAVGPQFIRANRGVLSRPTVAEIREYRAHVDMQMDRLFETRPERCAEHHDVIEIGLHHEQQHQELVLTDIKHVFSQNPLLPAYHERALGSGSAAELQWHTRDEGVYRIGASPSGFSYDNERQRHRVFLDAFALASRLVTNAEYLEFVRDGGYSRPALWLSDGWNEVQRSGWTAPLYWFERDGCWSEFTLSGPEALRPELPVTHVSYFEADAYARWRGQRLPTEAEWEVFAADSPIAGNFVESGRFHPQAAGSATDAVGSPQQLYGDVWEWTASAYLPYPGYSPPTGALGEYNGKFMSNQMVLRGGSCATPRDHVRATYRNFFYPTARWQFSGIRLAAGV